MSAPAGSRFPLVIYVQDGRCSSVWPAFETYRSTIAALGAALIAVESHELHRDAFWNSLGFCPGEFKVHSSLGDRVLDYLQVIQTLRAGSPEWDRRIIWIGDGAGGIVVLQVAPMVAETRALVLLNSGGGLAAMEELALSKRKALKGRGASEDQINRVMETMGQQFRTIRDQSESTKKWQGQTYKWWASLFAVDTLRNLEHAAGPIYMGHGTEDSSIPVESADIIADRYKTLGKTNLTYMRYDGLDHDWRDKQGKSHKEKVMSDMLHWLQTQIQPKN